jgi:two-component system nitrate/nitrite response regulator NarL
VGDATGIGQQLHRPSAPACTGASAHLSERERQILQLIADGKSVPDMATELFLAQTTIKTHIRRLYEKLGVSDRGAAVAQAMRNQLLE